MPPKKRPRGYRTQITESLLEAVLKIVTDVVDWAQNVTTIPTLYRRPPMLTLRWNPRLRKDLEMINSYYDPYQPRRGESYTLFGSRLPGATSNSFLRG